VFRLTAFITNYLLLVPHNYSLLVIGIAVGFLDGNFVFIHSGCVLSVTVQHTNVYLFIRGFFKDAFSSPGYVPWNARKVSGESVRITTVVVYCKALI